MVVERDYFGLSYSPRGRIMIEVEGSISVLQRALWCLVFPFTNRLPALPPTHDFPMLLLEQRCPWTWTLQFRLWTYPPVSSKSISVCLGDSSDGSDKETF